MKTENLLLLLGAGIFLLRRSQINGAGLTGHNLKAEKLAIKLSKQLRIPTPEIIFRGNKNFTFFWEGNNIEAAKKLSKFLKGQGKLYFDYDLESDSTVLYLDA